MIYLTLIPLTLLLLTYITYKTAYKHGYTHGAYDKETQIRKQHDKIYNKHINYKPPQNPTI